MNKRSTAPGRSHRQGISLIELMERFPDDETAERWFEHQVWPDGRFCPDCGSTNTYETPAAQKMPYRCRDCKHYFSVRKATVMRSSKLGYRKWAIAIYLFLTNIKGISAMRLHRELDVSYPSAWHLLHRLREAFNDGVLPLLGDVEVDETYVGGKEKNKHSKKRLKAGRGTVGKAIVIGAKARDSGRVRAAVIESASAAELRKFVGAVAGTSSQLFTDQYPGYAGLPNRRMVRHSQGEYVRGNTHTQGIESFWSMLKRGYIGVYHTWSFKHLHRYVNEFAGRHNLRSLDTADQMSALAWAMGGRRLRRADLVGGVT